MISWPGPGVRLWRALHYLCVCVGLSSRALFIHRGNKVMNNQLTIYILTNRLHVHVRHWAPPPSPFCSVRDRICTIDDGLWLSGCYLQRRALPLTLDRKVVMWWGGGGVTTYHIAYYISISIFPRDNSINKGKFFGNVEFWVATACYWF